MGQQESRLFSNGTSTIMDRSLVSSGGHVTSHIYRTRRPKWTVGPLLLEILFANTLRLWLLKHALSDEFVQVCALKLLGHL